MSYIQIELADETYELECKLGAFKSISERFGGFVGAFRKLAEVDVDSIAFIIAAGAGKPRNSKVIEKITEGLLEEGLEDALPKLTEFLSLLSAGGTKRAEAQSETAGE